MINRISAADNTLIEHQPGQWRLMQVNGDNSPYVLASAEHHQLKYGDAFGSTRRLPTSGYLPAQHIQQVVLGWSYEDEAWHLGLLLGPELASARGSRWCELAAWPDPDIQVFQDHASYAGQALAQTLALPFYLVPVRPIEIPKPVPLPELPLRFGVWKMEVTGDGRARIVREKGWQRAFYSRIAWYGLWTIIYLVISIATLVSDLALPNAGTLLPSPQILPLMGLATAFILMGMILHQIYVLNTQVDTVLLDPNERSISAWKGRNPLWKMGWQDIQSVYVSEVMKKKDTTAIAYHGEINLHRGGGSFRFVLEQSKQEDNTHARKPDWQRPQQEEVMPLMTSNVNTDLQAAGLHIAQVMGDVPCWYDYRLR